MAVVLVFILGLILWGFIGNRKEQEKEKELLAKKREDMEAKVREAETLIPSVETSTFYKEVSAYINNFIAESDKAVRWAVTRAYNEYRRSCSGYMKHVGLDDVGWKVEIDYGMEITCENIWKLFLGETTGQSFSFQNHGYASLTKSQLYALVKAILRDFTSLNISSSEEIWKCVFGDRYAKIELSLSPQYCRSIAELELQRLQADQTPYKNAF